MSGVRLDDGACSLRACNNRVTSTGRTALRPSQLLTLAIDGFGAPMAIVGMTLRMSCVWEIGMKFRSVRANEPDGHVDWPSATIRIAPSAIFSLSRKDMMDARSRSPSRRAPPPCFPMTAIPRRRGLTASKTLMRKGRSRMVEEAGRSRSFENARLPRPTNLGCWRRASRSAKGYRPSTSNLSRPCDAAVNSERASLRGEHGRIAL